MSKRLGFHLTDLMGTFLFKILLVSFAALMFLARNCVLSIEILLELIEGPDSFGKYSDRDANLEPPDNKIVTNAIQTS